MKDYNRVGEKHTTNEGYPITIFEYFDAHNCSIVFECGFKLYNRQYNSVKLGTVKNPYHPSVYGIGYLGQGEYKTKKDNKPTKVYKTWAGMLERCYDVKFKEKYPTYKGCSVDEKWHNFQVFAKWFEENYTEKSHLDKDIMIKGNKIYSPETCCFVPQAINSIFSIKPKPLNKTPYYHKFQVQMNKYGKKIYIGLYDTELEALLAYKEAKKDYINEVATEYFNNNQLTYGVYMAIINRKI